MSFDISIHIPYRHDTTQEYWSWHGFTYNLAPMLVEAGLPMRDQDGQLLTPANVTHLQTVHATMRDNPDRFKQLNPPNGWGDYEGCVHFVKTFASEAEGAVAECERSGVGGLPVVLVE